MGKKNPKTEKDKLKSRMWVCTRNYKNVPLDCKPQEFLQRYFERSNAKYIIGQVEMGEAGNPHIQFALYLKRRLRKFSLIKFDKHTDYEPVFIDNGIDKYCSKLESRIEGPWEFGNKDDTSNEKTDWAKIREAVCQPKVDWESIPASTYLLHINKLEKAHSAYITSLKPSQIRKHVKVYYLSGNSAAGKSNFALYMCCYGKKGEEAVDLVKYTGQFWMGTSESCRCCIYDDFRDNKIKEEEFVNFIDYNRHLINVKFTQHLNNYEVIIITSVFPMNEIFKNSKEDKTQWLRRMKEIKINSDYFTRMNLIFNKFILVISKCFKRLLKETLSKIIK